MRMRTGIMGYAIMDGETGDGVAGWVSIRGYGTSIRYIILERQSCVLAYAVMLMMGATRIGALCCSVHGDSEAARRTPQQSLSNRAELVCEGIGVGVRGVSARATKAKTGWVAGRPAPHGRSRGRGCSWRSGFRTHGFATCSAQTVPGARPLAGLPLGTGESPRKKVRSHRKSTRLTCFAFSASRSRGCATRR